VDVIIRGGRLGEGDVGEGVDQSGWGTRGCDEERGDGERGKGDGGVVHMVGGEMDRGGSMSSLMFLSSSNLQRRFRVFFCSRWRCRGICLNRWRWKHGAVQAW
jgi:hypothetical protein